MIIGIDASRAFVKEKTGTETYSLQVIKEMLRLPASLDHKFVLFVRPNCEIPLWSRRKNVKIVVIRLPYLWTQIGLAMQTWLQLGLDVLFVPAHTLPVLRDPRLRTVVTIHGIEYKWLPEYKNWLQRWYLPLSTRYAAKSATRLIVVSENTKRDLLNEIHIDTQKISVILEGSDNQNTQTTRLSDSQIARILRKWQLDDNKYILFVGSLQPRKNIPKLIEAFAVFSRRNPEYKLVVAGGLGWLTGEIFAEARRHDVQEKVIFTGRIDEREKEILYDQASVYVQPSETEGFGIPVLEAMARGIPVVTSDGGALPEVASDAAVIVPLGSGYADRLARAIAKVVQDTTTRKKLIKAGRVRSMQLTWKKCAQETLKVLTSL